MMIKVSTFIVNKFTRSYCLLLLPDADSIDGMDQSSIFLKGEESKREEIVINIDMEWSGAFNFGDAALRLVQLLEVPNIERIFCQYFC